MTYCCKEKHTTKFCPHCGKQLQNTHGIDGLRRHIDVTVKRFCLNFEAALKRGDEPACAKLGRAIDKWNSWQTAIQDIDKAIQDKPPLDDDGYASGGVSEQDRNVHGDGTRGQDRTG